MIIKKGQIYKMSDGFNYLILDSHENNFSIKILKSNIKLLKIGTVLKWDRNTIRCHTLILDLDEQYEAL